MAQLAKIAETREGAKPSPVTSTASFASQCQAGCEAEMHPDQPAEAP